ncbi:glycosyltransferase family 4 protein [Sphingobacterium thermophilum]|uniref:Glycosyltransferase family 4 protein n=1 Tax=Sphingobacterium thermophilum TaxID=768534 RepID=A0ABP8R2E1_9SPHI
MRILVVHNYYQHKGGEDVVFRQEVEALQQIMPIETLTFQNRKGFAGLLQFALYPWNPFAARKIVRKAKECGADIVHFHNLHYAIGPLAIRHLHKAGFKTIQTLHNHRLLDPSATLFVRNKVFLDTIDRVFPWKSVWQKSLDNSLLKTFWTAWTYYIHHKLNTWKMVDRYLVFSQFMKSLILRSPKNIQEARITVKTNAVEKPSSAALTPREDFFLYIGRLSQEKGVESLLEAFKTYSQQRLVIYGDGPLRAAVELASKQHHNIIYKGFQPKEVLASALASCQALIVPSICLEGMPMTLLEAYALGTPVLASNLGVLSEIVINGKTGLHVEANNPKDLGETVKQFALLDKEEKQFMSDNCLKEYEEKYTLDKNVQQLIQVYKEIIASA